MNVYFKNRMMRAGVLSLMAGAAALLPIVANAESYTVKSGDTLSAIAASHQTTVEKSDTTEETVVSPSSGLSAEDAEAKEWIAQKESSGSYTAQNGQYYGRYQLTILFKWRFVTRKSREDSGCLCSRSLWLMVSR